MQTDSRWRASFRRRLLNWFRQHARKLPWRQNRNRYRIWVSEIMLQQTQVATVIDYYSRFIQRFPTVSKLANADQSEVLKLWEGLGYYRRARQMHAAAQQIVDRHDGEFPADFDSVLALPGIGRYSAGAILSIADDQRLPILEGNTIRLFARLTETRDDPRSSANQRRLWDFSQALLPRRNCGDFNQALMELGSLVCQPKSPRCDQCPVADLCPTFVKGLQQHIPASTARLNYQDLNQAVVLVQRRGRYLLRQCGDDERWAGLWDFPRFTVDHRQPAIDLAEQLQEMTGLAARIESCHLRIKHSVTRYRITLDCYRTADVKGRTRNSRSLLAWKTAAEMEQLPMSVTGRKIARKLDSLNPPSAARG